MMPPVINLILKRCLIFVFIFSSMTIYAVEYGKNLLENGGAELGTLVGGSWVNGTLGQEWSIRSNNPSPYEGNHYFSVKVIESVFSSTLTQDVDVNSYADAIDSGSQCFELSAVISGYKNLGVSGSVYVNSVKKLSHPEGLSTWSRQKSLVILPPGTRKISVALHAYYFNMFDSVEEGALQYFDDIRLIALDPNDCQPRYKRNLLESYSASNWANHSGSWEYREEDPFPREGVNFHFAGTSGGIAGRYSNIDLKDYIDEIQKGNQHFKISSYMAGYHGTDEAFQSYTFFDSQNKIISFFNSPVYKSKKVWRYYTKTLRAPKNAVRLKIILHSDRKFGLNSDGYHDDVRVVALNPNQFKSRDLLFNGSADMPITSSYGWVNVSGKYGHRNSDPTGKDNGPYFYCQNNYCKAYQLIDVSEFREAIDKEIQEFRYTGYQSGWNSRDTSEVAVEYIGLDKAGNHQRLSIWWSGRLTSSKSWKKKTYTRVAPKGTRFVKIHLFSRHGGGWFNNNNDGYIDAMSFLKLPVDRDGDGIPNIKELEWGLNPDDPADGGLDADNDGFTNVQEYELGTDPLDPSAYPVLKIDAFYSDRTYKYAGDDTPINLYWKVYGAESVDIFQNGTLIHSETNSGYETITNSLAIDPARDTTYQLIANGPNGIGSGSLHIGYKEPIEYKQWPQTLPDDHDFILDSMTVLSDGSHFIARTDESYNYYAYNDSGLKVLQWQIKDLGLVYKKAILVNGMAIISISSANQSKGRVVAINDDGSMQWVFEADTPIKAKPITDSNGQSLFSVGYFGKIYSLDIQTGDLLWSHQIPEEDVIVLSDPVLKEEKNSYQQMDMNKSLLIIRTTGNRIFAYRTNGISEYPIWHKSL